MSRTALAAVALVAASAVTAGQAAAADAVTTRIEPRNVYGATVTIEHGVRVFRPLPSQQHVIVNPGRVPLGLGYVYDSTGWGAGAEALPPPARVR